MADPDPFRHHPELRGQIKPASGSFFRDLDLEAVDAKAAAAGRPSGWRTPCEVRESGRRDWFDGRWDRDVWVFGYGSLMWDPSIEFAEVRRGRTKAYSRSFCIWDMGARGSPDRPGLMLAIDAGTGCEGLAFRIEAAKLEHETFVLFRREMITSTYRPIWLTLETALGPIEALSFAADRGHERIVPDIPTAEQARMIAKAEGLLGSNFDYLADTRAHLSLLGVEDSYITDLYRRAAELRAVIDPL
ncbi:MAG: gamma-glutamylcyclotransferase [Pseudomonadota bacterium]